MYRPPLHRISRWTPHKGESSERTSSASPKRSKPRPPHRGRHPLADHRGRVERAVVIDVVAATWNCGQHIPLLFRAADVEAAMSKKQERIDELERQLATRKSG